MTANFVAMGTLWARWVSLQAMKIQAMTSARFDIQAMIFKLGYVPEMATDVAAAQDFKQKLGYRPGKSWNQLVQQTHGSLRKRPETCTVILSSCCHI